MPNTHINLDMVFNWRNCGEIVTKLQDFGVIPRDGEIKCPVDHCNGYFKLYSDESRSDGVRWSCTGKIVRSAKSKAVKCTNR